MTLIIYTGLHLTMIFGFHDCTEFFFVKGAHLCSKKIREGFESSNVDIFPIVICPALLVLRISFSMPVLQLVLSKHNSTSELLLVQTQCSKRSPCPSTMLLPSGQLITLSIVIASLFNDCFVSLMIDDSDFVAIQFPNRA